METSNTDTSLKPTLSSTKSIDEGFESDPDREQSNTESESNQQSANNGSLSSSSVDTHQHTFDILQRTDRDGVQHTQITRRPIKIEISNQIPFENSTNTNQRRNKELEKTRIVYPNPKVSIPRAGASNQRIITSNISLQQQQQQQIGILSSNHMQYNPASGNNNNNNNNSASIIDQRHRLAGKSIELSNSRLAKATDLVLRSSGRERLNFSNAISMDNLSQVALINGKLICVNMPVTQIIPLSSIPSASASSLANGSHNHTLHSTKRHFLSAVNNNNSNSNTNTNNNTNINSSNIIGNNSNNSTTKINQYSIGASTTSHHSNHHQKYISNGRCNTNESNSIAKQVNNAIIQNANSSNTFYPAQGNISLISSQYGLKYKSTHLNGMQEQPVPIPLWSQSLARQQRR